MVDLTKHSINIFFPDAGEISQNVWLCLGPVHLDEQQILNSMSMVCKCLWAGIDLLDDACDILLI